MIIKRRADLSVLTPGSSEAGLSEAGWSDAVRPLGAADLALVEGALADLAPHWSVELHGFRADEATLVLAPDDGDDAVGPSFLISRESGGLRLDQVRWDRLTEVGLFGSLRDAVRAIEPRLAFCGVATVAALATLH